MGWAGSSTGHNYGVEGTSESEDGIGVLARAISYSGYTYALYAEAASPDGTGAFADAIDTTGDN